MIGILSMTGTVQFNGLSRNIGCLSVSVSRKDNEQSFSETVHGIWLFGFP